MRLPPIPIAMTSHIYDLAARCARGVDVSSAQRGRGERRMPVAPAASCALCIGRTHTSRRVPRNHPTFPHAMVLTVSFELSPVTGLFCHHRLRIKSCLSPVGPTRLRKLDASIGASGPHDFAVRCNISRPLAVDRSQVFRQLALQSHRAQNAAASTAPLPASVTIMIRPLWGGMRKVLDLIWGKWEQKYFSEKQK